jgi:hypothetical protein
MRESYTLPGTGKDIKRHVIRKRQRIKRSHQLTFDLELFWTIKSLMKSPGGVKRVSRSKGKTMMVEALLPKVSNRYYVDIN